MSKVHTINGVPYVVNEANEAILYGSNPPLRIGTTDAKKTTITLDDNWQVNAALTLTKYRSDLKEITKAALEKARQLQNSK
jgi:hypothetical protein